MAPTGGRSGSALCPLWEGAADIAGEGWTAAFGPNADEVRIEMPHCGNPDFLLANQLSCRSMIWGSGCNLLT